MEKKKVIIIGAGGHGKVILDILSFDDKIEVIGFIDDNPLLKGNLVNGIRVIGSFDEVIENIPAKAVVVAIGDNKIRTNFFEKCKEKSLETINAIHPSAVISKNVKIGEGAVIMAGVIINSGAYIGNNVCVNTQASIDHDCYLDDNCHIWPGAVLTGTVKVGKLSYIGSGAIVLPKLKIGERCMVGAGAVVTKEVLDNTTVIGIPARVINENIN